MANGDSKSAKFINQMGNIFGTEPNLFRGQNVVILFEVKGGFDSPSEKHVLLILLSVMLCIIWYYLYNLKNVKNIHGGVLLLVTF